MTFRLIEKCGCSQIFQKIQLLMLEENNGETITE